MVTTMQLSLDKERSFSIYATCSVEYNGRAYSTLETGRYLVIYKPDKSMMIHGSDLTIPKNYMSSCDKFIITNNTLIFKRKTETITITIDEILSLVYYDEWSNHKIKISRTEKDLVNKICDNWLNYFPTLSNEIIREHPTDLGPIDIFGRSLDLWRIIEVKRKRATIKDVSQLKRYVEAVSKLPLVPMVDGYLAAPDIGDKAKNYLENSGLHYLQVTF